MNKVKWGEFNVTDVFDVKNTGNILSRDVIKNSGETPYLCASTENNGVKSYVSHKEELLEEGNCIFIGGKTFVVSYQEKNFYSNDSHNLVLYLKNEKKRNRPVQLFLAACINKSLGYKYSWDDSISNRKIQKDKVSLPIRNDKIDFDFIELFISHLEIKRLAELKAYLNITGLKNIALNDEEKQALVKFEKGKVKFSEFEIQTLFLVSPSKAYTKNDGEILNKNGKTPYISNQSQNNGLIGWSNLKPLNPSNVITLSDTWQSERTIFYQPNEFIGKSHLQVMKPYDLKFQKFELFFVMSSFRKAILELNYDYGTKFNRTKIKKTKIQLPTINNEIDFPLMSSYISAIHKLVMNDVVTYLNKRLAILK